MNKPKKVLVIDDDEAVREIFQFYLKEQNYEVTVAADGQEGLEVFARNPVDIVLTDIRMPVMDGLAFIKAMKAQSPDTPIVVISGAGSLQEAIEAIRQGAWDYLVKPIDEADQLDMVIRRNWDRARLLIENRRHREQLEQLVEERTRILRQSEERYKQLLSSVTDYIYKVDIKDGQPVATTHGPGCAAVTGYTPKEYASDRFLWFEMIDPQDRQAVLDHAQTAMRGEVTDPLEHRLIHKNGTTRWVRNTLVARQDAGGKLIACDGLISDISERKQAENEIRTLNAELEQRVAQRTKQLEAANQELEAFSYSVSHDLRAPLRAIDGFAHMLVDQTANRLTAEDQRLLDVISSQAKRMGQLIDDLLRFSQLGRQPMQSTNIDMTAMAQTVFAEFTAQIQGRELRLRLEPLPPAQGDPSMIRQVWVNLLSNAIKYTAQKAMASIEISSRSEGNERVYCVKDNGAGFDMKYARQLFGVFHRLHHESEFEGTGVGLALVQRIIHRHGGRIWAEAKIQEGAAFNFTLPIPPDLPR